MTIILLKSKAAQRG